MKVVKFRLSGRTAFFKRPDVNTYFYFTYGHVHKVALCGMFGAILGYKGYGQFQKEDVYPEFYTRLNHLRISVVPIGQKGMFSKKIQVFNNSVGYASKEQGGNLIVKEQWLENPVWDIYVQVNDEESEKLMEVLLQETCVYVPYLGKNDHFAVISGVQVFEGIQEVQSASNLDSLFLRDFFQIHFDDEDEEEEPYKYEERLPVALNKETHLYETCPFVLTNMKVQQIDEKIYRVEDRNVTFH